MNLPPDTPHTPMYPVADLAEWISCTPPACETMAAEKGVGAAGLATGGEVAGKATAKTGQAAAEEADAAAAWSAGASGLATGGEAAGVQLEPGGS